MRRFESQGHWLLHCPACRHECFDLLPDDDHVARVYGDEYFAGGGAGYPDYLAEGRLLRDRGRWYARRLARFMQPGRMLDVGSAAGFVLQGFRDLGWDAEGLEPNASMARYARETLGLRVAATDLVRFRPESTYDLVAMIQVIAHLPDPRDAVAKVHAMLQPGGHLLVETWNSASLSARILGRHWHEYSPPSVLHCFTIRSLRRLMADTGFREIACGRPSKWISASHAASLLHHKFGGREWMRTLVAAAPKRLRLPYPSEDLVWMLLRRA